MLKLLHCVQDPPRVLREELLELSPRRLRHRLLLSLLCVLGALSTLERHTSRSSQMYR